jgi:hypothetical protein
MCLTYPLNNLLNPEYGTNSSQLAFSQTYHYAQVSSICMLSITNREILYHMLWLAVYNLVWVLIFYEMPRLISINPLIARAAPMPVTTPRTNPNKNPHGLGTAVHSSKIDNTIVSAPKMAETDPRAILV